MTKKLILTIAIMFFVPIFANAEIANEARLEYNKGIDCYKNGQYETAAKYFRLAIDISPDFIDAYYNLGSILEYLKQYDAALLVFQQIVVRQPNDSEAVYKAALTASKLGKNGQALKYLTLIPETSEYYNQAKTLSQMISSGETTYNDAQTKPQIPTQGSFLYEGIQGPTGLVTDPAGNLYVACYSDNVILKITPEGKRIVIAKDDRKINGPIGIARDSVGNIYVANYNNDNILKITITGEIKILMGNIKKPYGLYVDKNMLYVSSQGSNAVLRYKL